MYEQRIIFIVSLLILQSFPFFVFGNYIAKSTFHHSEQLMGYGHDGKIITLGESIFGGILQLEDIYLTSKLMKEGIVKQPSGSGFGTIPEQLYPATLAPTKLLWDAHAQTDAILFDIGYFFTLSEKIYKKVVPSLIFFGVSFSSKKMVHHLDLDTESGKIAIDGSSFVPGGESTVKQFFSDANIDVTDFFKRYVIGPKKLRYKPILEHLGLGDTRLTAFVDWGGRFEWLKTAQLAFILSVPTGQRDICNALWPLHAGSGHVECTLQGALNLSTSIPYFNPFWQCSFTLHAPYNENRRVVQTITDQTFDKQKYLAPRFQSCIVDPFSELDSQSPAFANETKMVTIYEGLSGHLMVGNMVSLYKNKLQCGLYYDFFFQNETTFDRKVPKTKYTDYSAPKKGMSHSFLYQMTYTPFKKLSFMLEFSQSIAGRNMGREFFASFSLLSLI